MTEDAELLQIEQEAAAFRRQPLLFAHRIDAQHAGAGTEARLGALLRKAIEPGEGVVDFLVRESGGAQLDAERLLIAGVLELTVVVVLEEVHQHIQQGLFHVLSHTPGPGVRGRVAARRPSVIQRVDSR